MKKLLTSLLIIASIVLTGCPKGEKTVRQLREKSAEMSIYGTKLITAFGEAYKAGEITQDQLRTLNTATGAFVTGVGIYREALAEAERQVKAGEAPKDVLGRVDRILDAQVIATFFKILERIAGLSVERSAAIQAILSAARVAILAIKNAVSEAEQFIREEPTYA